MNIDWVFVLWMLLLVNREKDDNKLDIPIQYLDCTLLMIVVGLGYSAILCWRRAGFHPSRIHQPPILTIMRGSHSLPPTTRSHSTAYTNCFVSTPLYSLEGCRIITRWQELDVLTTDQRMQCCREQEEYVGSWNVPFRLP